MATVYSSRIGADASDRIHGSRNKSFAQREQERKEEGKREERERKSSSKARAKSHSDPRVFAVYKHICVQRAALYHFERFETDVIEPSDFAFTDAISPGK